MTAYLRFSGSPQRQSIPIPPTDSGYHPSSANASRYCLKASASHAENVFQICLFCFIAHPPFESSDLFQVRFHDHVLPLSLYKLLFFDTRNSQLLFSYVFITQKPATICFFRIHEAKRLMYLPSPTCFPSPGQPSYFINICFSLCHIQALTL